MRRILLRLARNRWLKERLPRFRFMRRAVRRFMPGETMDDALAAARTLVADGITSEYTRLGENLTSLAEADAVAEHYAELLDRIDAAGLDGEISVKLTHLGLDLAAEAAYRHCERLAAQAEASGHHFWIDMEDSSYVDATLALCARLRAGHPLTGVCLQAYLRRTAADVERLIPLGPAIRLVKGAYDEPASVAFRSRKEVDANYAAIAVTLLRAGASAGSGAGSVAGAGAGEGRVRLGLGTHDVALIEQIAAHAAAAGIGRDAFEVQMLYGIRAGEQRRLAREGYRVRTLIAYGESWYPWYMRRLAERPANVLFALRQLLP